MKLTSRPEVQGIGPGGITLREQFAACLADARCRAEYERGQQSSWFEQAIGTAFDIFAPGLSAIIPIIPRGELLGPWAAFINPLSLPPPELTARVGLAAAGHALAGGGPAMNGFGDIFTDLGSYFTGESSFTEALFDVGGDILGGAQQLVPSLVQRFTAPAQTAPMPRFAPPAQPRYSPSQYLLPEFLRTPQEEPFTGVPSGSAPPGQWEIDTYGGPGTMGLAMGGGAAMMVPMVRGMGKVGLIATVNAMRSGGVPATVSWLVSLIRKFGPAAAVGFLASWVEDQLANRAVMEAYAHRRRRMNPANTKALRRSLRRLQSFDRLSCRVSNQLARVGGRGRARRKTCPKCKRSPCRCA